MGAWNLQSLLNRLTPGAAHAHLGDVLYTLINQHNALLAHLDSVSQTPVNASVTLTIAGTMTVGNTVSLTFTNALLPALVGGVGLGAIAVVSGDTATLLAARIAAAITANTKIPLTATNASGVVTIVQPGMVGNSTTVSVALSSGATVTAALANSGALAGGSGGIGNANLATFAAKLPEALIGTPLV